MFMANPSFLMCFKMHLYYLICVIWYFHNSLFNNVNCSLHNSLFNNVNCSLHDSNSCLFWWFVSCVETHWWEKGGTEVRKMSTQIKKCRKLLSITGMALQMLLGYSCRSVLSVLDHLNETWQRLDLEWGWAQTSGSVVSNGSFFGRTSVPCCPAFPLLLPATVTNSKDEAGQGRAGCCLLSEHLREEAGQGRWGACITPVRCEPPNPAVLAHL